MQIGKAPRKVSENLVDLLLDCHQRIRSFCALARQVSEQSDFRSEEVVNACQGVVKYFTQALPLHVHDEEESILPRLIGKQQKVDDALGLMQTQHASHEMHLERLVAVCSGLTLPAADAITFTAELRPLAENVERELLAHLQMEETVIFPAVDAQLSVDEQVAIVRELRARRQFKLKPALGV